MARAYDGVFARGWQPLPRRARKRNRWHYNDRVNDDLLHLVWLALSWVSYAVIHSLGASLRFKTWVATRFPAMNRCYRLFYNAAAALLLAGPLWLLFSYPGGKLWHYPAPVRWTADGLALLAALGFLHSLHFYDTGEFIGLKQWRTAASDGEDRAPMTLSWLHRFVRHPWYFFGLVILWTREPDAALLLSNLLITGYLAIGSRLEENKLIAVYGDRYRRYRRKVPGLVPLPWRFLSRDEAEALMRNAAEPAMTGTSPRRRR